VHVDASEAASAAAAQGRTRLGFAPRSARTAAGTSRKTHSAGIVFQRLQITRDAGDLVLHLFVDDVTPAAHFDALFILVTNVLLLAVLVVVVVVVLLVIVSTLLSPVDDSLCAEEVSGMA